MAEPAKRKAAANKMVAPTDYTVLKLVTLMPVTKITDVYDTDDLVTLERIQLGMWMPIGEAPARAKKAAIDAIVGDRAGVFKAVATSAWRGGEERFEQTKIASKPLDE